MSELTPNLKLFKYNTETDAKQSFSINDCMNANWDKIDASLGSLEICDIGMSLYVDESKGKRRYLNGQIVDRNANTEAFFTRLQQITTLHPSLLCTEDEWQTAKTMSAFGQVGKFVFNYSGEDIVSVRIPRVVNIQGLFDLQNLGMTVAESLPNITGSLKGDNNTVAINGAFKDVSATVSGFHIETVSSTSNHNVTFDASRSSSTYQDNAPVQQEAIQYPYFIQIATGSETEANIVNTLENVNGFTLLESKYSDKPLYNESWLLSNGQWNAKAVYPTVYEGLQVEYNSEIEAGTTVTLPSGVSYTKRGLSVKLSTEEYTDYDFVLNTADETFRLPLKIKQKFYDDTAPVVGNGMTLGLTDGINNFGLSSDNGAATNTITGVYNQNIGYSSWTKEVAANGIGVTTDPTKSGIETHLTETILYLYFYVGDLDQNHGIVNMGRIAETMATKSMVDGQWVVKKFILASGQTIDNTTNITYDLSEYLPNDGYGYEVMFYGNASTVATDNAYVTINLTNDYNLGITVARARARSNASYQAASTCILPIGVGRFVTLGSETSENHKGSVNVYALAYRRLGTNV